MKCEIPNELREKIEKNFKTNEKLKKELLSGNPEAIKEIGIISQKCIKPEEIVEAYENGEMDYLYKKAKKIIERKEIYNELLKEYIAKKNSENEHLEEK